MHAFKLSHVIKLSLLVALMLLGIATAHAEQTRKYATIKAYAIDGSTITSSGNTIALWGVQAPGIPNSLENLQTRSVLDSLMGNGIIRCAAIAAPKDAPVRAHCVNADGRDIGLALITGGLAATNAHDMDSSALAATYRAAERDARALKAGIWHQGPTAQNRPSSTNTLIEAEATLTSLLPVIVPTIGFLLLTLIIHINFKRIANLQKQQLAGTQKRERQLKDRERFVIAAALEGEINANRAKLDAFLVIYEELLKSLRDPARKPKYQRAGDVIHDKPALARSVYDAHVEKLDLLGPHVSGELASLYALIDPAPDYRTLEPELPLDKACDIVERIVRSATAMGEPMDKAAAALGVIVRDKRAAVTQ